MSPEALSNVSQNQTAVAGLEEEGHKDDVPLSLSVLLILDSSIPGGCDVNLGHVVPRSCLLPGFLTIKLCFISLLENWASESSPPSRVRELTFASQESGIKVGQLLTPLWQLRSPRRYFEAIFCFSVTFHSLFEYWSVDPAYGNSSSTREHFSALNTH